MVREFKKNKNKIEAQRVYDKEKNTLTPTLGYWITEKVNLICMVLAYALHGSVVFWSHDLRYMHAGRRLS